jgi:SAM-dependent methyltransferase
VGSLADGTFGVGDHDFFGLDVVINRAFMRDFSLPLLEKLFPGQRDIKVLSVGCGIGMDVDILIEQGYSAWGTDCGSRTLAWPYYSHHPQNLIRCTDDDLPFTDGFFDFVMCHQVLEHVGVVGDSMVLSDDSKARRQRFINNLLRVTKVGGHVNLATPNRLFPIDPGHGQNFFGVRLHGPFDHFLTSYGDMQRYAPTMKVQALSPLGYYTGSLTSKSRAVGSAFTRFLEFVDRHPRLHGSPLNPLMNALITRQ